MPTVRRLEGNGAALLWLKAFRKFQGRSQSDMGAALGKSQGHYQKIESGVVGFTAQDALKLCNLLGLSLSNLVRTDWPLIGADGGAYFVNYVCTGCGGDDVKDDSYSSWDSVNQCWEHCSEFDNTVCEDCGGDCSLESKVIEIHPDMRINKESAHANPLGI